MDIGKETRRPGSRNEYSKEKTGFKSQELTEVEERKKPRRKIERQ